MKGSGRSLERCGQRKQTALEEARGTPEPPLWVTHFGSLGEGPLNPPWPDERHQTDNCRVTQDSGAPLTLKGSVPPSLLPAGLGFRAPEPRPCSAPCCPFMQPEPHLDRALMLHAGLSLYN